MDTADVADAADAIDVVDAIDADDTVDVINVADIIDTLDAIDATNATDAADTTNIHDINWSSSITRPTIADNELLQIASSFEQLEITIAYDFTRFNFKPNIMESIILQHMFKHRLRWQIMSKDYMMINPVAVSCNVRPEFWMASFRAYNFVDEKGDSRVNEKIFNRRWPFMEVAITTELFLKYMHCRYFEWQIHISDLLNTAVNNDVFLKHEVPSSIVLAACHVINDEVYLKYRHTIIGPLMYAITILRDSGVLSDEFLLEHDDIPPLHLEHLQNRVGLHVLQKYEDIWDYDTINNPTMPWELFTKHVNPLKMELNRNTMQMLSHIAPLPYILNHGELNWFMNIVLTRNMGNTIKSANKKT